MFRFKSIHIKNFGPYKDVTIQFPEEKGVTIIWGNNGQGKTTVLNSFKFLLFNMLVSCNSVLHNTNSIYALKVTRLLTVFVRTELLDLFCFLIYFEKVNWFFF